MADKQEFEGLLDRLRRHSTMSPSNGSAIQSQQQQQQQPPPQPPQSQPPQSYTYQPPSVESVQQSPQPQPQFHPEQPLYGALHRQSQQNTPEISPVTESPSSTYPAQQPPSVPQPDQTQPAAQAMQAVPPYSLPMSPPVGDASRTASLLQLLKFSEIPTSPQTESPILQTEPAPRPPVASPPPADIPLVHNRAISASDLVASLFGRPTPDSANTRPGSGSRTGSIGSGTTSSSPVRSRAAEPAPQREKPQVNPQDLVFQLLGRSKPVQDERSSPPTQTTEPNAQQVRDSGVYSQSSSSTPKASTPDTQSMPAPPSLRAPSADPPPGNSSAKGMFTYVNPFEQIHATSPRNKTPKISTPVPTLARKSALGFNETRSDSVTLPYSPSPPVSNGPQSATSPATIEADAAKEATTLDEVRGKEYQLMEQAEQPKPSVMDYLDTSPGQQDDPVERSIEPVDKPGEENDRQAPVEESYQTNGIGDFADIKREIKDEEEAYESASETNVIEVYNFPMKPFSSITIVPSAIKRPKYPIAKIADIAKMNRSFDQLDRNLMAASHEFIVYAISKSNGRGGIRVIRQFDGKDRVLMKDNTDRTFNVTITKGERVLGTSISGAVIWVDLKTDFSGDNWNSMFVFPPSEEQGQSNGVLKSRARKTSRHSNVFAIGRGKTISIIHALAAKAYSSANGHEVASKKYLAEHARTIDTGKASKDFTFSDDDTVIISIDKAGKLKLWDVQEILEFSDLAYASLTQGCPPQPPMVLSSPTLVFSAVASGESYRATSVMFLDKFRPYHKCLALRYVIVGMKQNHTLQLWDLALGRPVQEINFPQQSDTDALCSVVYHSLSGIIVVGNPTRNSIYFIHLSAPKYNLPPMSQAQYLKGLATKDPTIPKPDATAILSGLREYAFPKGQLMSLDILDTEDTEVDTATPPLFELYVAHSKGMTTLSVYKDDLGWEPDNRVKYPVDAVQKGACALSSLPAPPPPEPEKDEKSEVAEPASLKPETASAKVNKSRSVSPAARGSEKSDVGESASVPGRKKKRDKTNAALSPPVVDTDGKPEKTAGGKGKATAMVPTGEQELNIGITPSFLDREVKRFEKTVTSTFTSSFEKQLEQLYRRIDEDRRVQAAASDAKQDAVLRLLSTTLTENVEQVISRIVVNNIQSQVVPAIADITVASVNRKLGESLTRSLAISLPPEIRSTVPDAVSRALGQPELMDRISDSLVRPLSQAIEREFTHTLQHSVMPAFQKLALDTVNKTVLETERKHSEAIATLENLRKQDSQKMDQIMVLVHGLSQTMNAMAKAQEGMAKAQSDFQEHVRQAEADYRSFEQSAPPVQEKPTPLPQKTPEQLEAEEIESLLRSGKYEDGTIKWLQSKERQAELFDEVMVRYRYDFLPNLSQLVLLSVSAAVSVKFEHKVMERLSWLEGVLAVLDPEDPEIHEICHRIMVVVVQRLEQLYMNTAEKNHQNPVLRKIPNIARRARELSALSQ